MNEVSWPLRLAPMLAYTSVYLGTCLVGATLLLIHWRPFVALFEYFSGTSDPTLTGRDLLVTLILLIAAPLVMWAGYILVTIAPLRPLEHLVTRFAPADLPQPRAVAVGLYLVLAAVSFALLAHAGSFSNLDSWLRYADWITARQTVFAHIGFAGFVVIYLLVPLAAAWVAIALPYRGWGAAAAVAAAVVAVAIQVLLFQKKAAIVAMLIIVTTVAIDVVARRRVRWMRWALVSAIAVAVLGYFALVVIPVYSEANQTVQTAVAAQGQKKPDPTMTPRQRKVSAEQSERMRNLRREVNLDSREKAVALYALLSPLTRTSAASLYYAKVFPHRHAYYGFGIGDGRPTDDTRVVWDYMNPTLPGGSVAAPFQFGMFALWGTFGSLAAACVAGAGLALLWRVVFSDGQPRGWRSMFAALVVLLAIYLAIDSAQNSILVSYGVFWGFVFVVAIALTTRITGRRYARARIPANQPSRG